MGEQTIENGWSLDNHGDNALDAYYYHFELTGIEVIDRILAEIAWAGKAYHSTEHWTDTIHNEKLSVASRIQAAADSAAREIRTLGETTSATEDEGESE